MSMDCKDCRMAVYDYLDRTLTAETRRLVEEHLASCAGCRAFYADEQARAHAWPVLLDEAARKVAAPEGLAGCLAAEIERARRSGFGWNRLGAGLAAAAALVLLFGGVLWAFVFRETAVAPAQVPAVVSLKTAEPIVVPVVTNVVPPVQIDKSERPAAVAAAVQKEGEEDMMKTQVVAAVAATVTAVAAPAVLMKASVAVAASSAASPPVVYTAQPGYAASSASAGANLEARAAGKETVTSCNLEARYRSFIPSNNSNLNSTKAHGFGIFLQ